MMAETQKMTPEGYRGIRPTEVMPDAGRICGVIDRVLFRQRAAVLTVFAVLTILFAFHASRLELTASYEKMIPRDHPYIINYLDHQNVVSAFTNVVRIVVEKRSEGDIFDAAFLETLKTITDEVFLLPGVDRGNLKSLWTPNVRWSTVTEEGFEGGTVIPDRYDGSPESLEEVRRNVSRSGEIGSLVATDFTSAVIYVPLIEKDPGTGDPIDYGLFAERLETDIRDRYQNEATGIRLIGFAKKVGDLIDGVTTVALFFLVALAIMAVLLLVYTRCLRSTALGILCSLVAIIWQLGVMSLLGFGIGPYSVLIPFLVFAIGVSHAVQIINATMLRVAAGADQRDAARGAFRALYAPGLTALLSDSVGFLTLVVIQILVIQEIALAAGIGVAMVVLTNLLLLPVLLSCMGVNSAAANRYGVVSARNSPLWTTLGKAATPTGARIVTVVAVLLLLVGLYGAQGQQIGDVDPGAPELRPDSRYNRDAAYLADHYATSSDVFVVMVRTKPDGCVAYETLETMDRLQWRLDNTAGVQGTNSMADIAKLGLQGLNEGNLKWRAINRNRLVTNATLIRAPRELYNATCDLSLVVVNLEDHKAETLTRAVQTVERFAAEYDGDGIELLLAAGNAGVEAATNIVIVDAKTLILVLVYAVVAVLVFITFRSWQALIVILTPLALTSVLTQALMAWLGIGVKVATLPVIALGVGIGIDYGIYIYDRLCRHLAHGTPLVLAYQRTLQTTGAAVGFTGLALAVGVATWIFAPIKFQADMGLLLTFMFLCNMLAAMLILPALMALLDRPSVRSLSLQDRSS